MTRPPLYLTVQEIDHARKRLMLGASLCAAADDLGVEPRQLDLALWARVNRHGKRLIEGKVA